MARDRVVVTGGAGFIGSHLVTALAECGDVTVIDNFSSGSPDKSPAARDTRVRIVEADVRDHAATAYAIHGATQVYHLATQCLRVSLVNPDLVNDVNVAGTLSVLEAARRAGIARFIYVSSSEVYGTAQTVPMAESHPCVPTTVYGASKLAGEHYARAYFGMYGLPFVIVRPFNTYGPRSHVEGLYGEVLPKFVLRMLAGRPPVVYGDGEQTRDFTHVTDTVRGIVLAGECEAAEGQTVNIARGEEISVNRLAALIGEAIGTELRPVHRPGRPGDVRRHCADIGLARRLLGYEPQVGIREGIAAYIEWFRRTHADLGPLLNAEETRDWETAG